MISPTRNAASVDSEEDEGDEEGQDGVAEDEGDKEGQDGVAKDEGHKQGQDGVAEDEGDKEGQDGVAEDEGDKEGQDGVVEDEGHKEGQDGVADEDGQDKNKGQDGMADEDGQDDMKGQDDEGDRDGRQMRTDMTTRKDTMVWKTWKSRTKETGMRSRREVKLWPLEVLCPLALLQNQVSLQGNNTLPAALSYRVFRMLIHV